MKQTLTKAAEHTERRIRTLETDLSTTHLEPSQAEFKREKLQDLGITATTLRTLALDAPDERQAELPLKEPRYTLPVGTKVAYKHSTSKLISSKTIAGAEAATVVAAEETRNGRIVGTHADSDRERMGVETLYRVLQTDFTGEGDAEPEDVFASSIVSHNASPPKTAPGRFETIIVDRAHASGIEEGRSQAADKVRELLDGLERFSAMVPTPDEMDFGTFWPMLADHVATGVHLLALETRKALDIPAGPALEAEVDAAGLRYHEAMVKERPEPPATISGNIAVALELITQANMAVERSGASTACTNANQLLLKAHAEMTKHARGGPDTPPPKGPATTTPASTVGTPSRVYECSRCLDTRRVQTEEDEASDSDRPCYACRSDASKKPEPRVTDFRNEKGIPIAAERMRESWPMSGDYVQNRHGQQGIVTGRHPAVGTIYVTQTDGIDASGNEMRGACAYEAAKLSRSSVQAHTKAQTTVRAGAFNVGTDVVVLVATDAEGATTAVIADARGLDAVTEHLNRLKKAHGGMNVLVCFRPVSGMVERQLGEAFDVRSHLMKLADRVGVPRSRLEAMSLAAAFTEVTAFINNSERALADKLTQAQRMLDDRIESITRSCDGLRSVSATLSGKDGTTT